MYMLRQSVSKIFYRKKRVTEDYYCLREVKGGGRLMRMTAAAVAGQTYDVAPIN